jgi:tRNA U34 5-methylaminomethyl-2-thiouridine-forming methyltransferase MnmC
LKKEIIITGDGSHTVSVPEMNVLYHSKHGAIQESMHVFIEAGLLYKSGRNPERQSKGRPDSIKIFEMGLGTGLNAFLTAIEAVNKKIKIFYVAVENFPLSTEEVLSLNYSKNLQHKEWFDALHQCQWNEDIAINEYFTFRKEQADIVSYSTNQAFNIIYYDAFAPTAQPELWTTEIFKKLNSFLYPEGILVTYCSKGYVRRAMQSAGFIVEKIPGPPGKREMVRAVAHPDLPEGKAI